MKRTLNLLPYLAFALVSIGSLTGCDKDEDDSNTNADVYAISTTMNGASEVPAVVSPGTGTVAGSYDASTNILQYNVAWTGLTGTATVGHFHGPALATATGAPIIHFNLVNNGNAGTATGTVTLTETQEADLLGGKWYANIHTGTNTGGEIRGQVAATK